MPFLLPTFLGTFQEKALFIQLLPNSLLKINSEPKMILFQPHLPCEDILDDFDPYSPFLDFQKQPSLALLMTAIGNYFVRYFVISVEFQSLEARAISSFLLFLGEPGTVPGKL